MLVKISALYRLTKPGVLFGNVLTGAAGYMLAAQGNVDAWLFIATVTGMTLVVASACVLNNYLDQDIDSVMERTKQRPSVVGAITGLHMVLFSALLGVAGTLVLYFWTNMLVTIIGLAGFITYVWLYGALSKRRSVHGTLVGSISGAMPVAGGYAAVSGRIDAGLVTVFLILFFWQFFEFYSIAIYRRKEYARARIPVMPVSVGVQATITQIFVYTVLYVASTLVVTILGYAGWVYFTIMLISGLYWIWIAAKGFAAKDTDAWARRMFRLSMWAILLLCGMFSVGPLLP